MSAELDQLTPNYLTVNPDGTIGADFTGSIRATGLSLNAGNSPSSVNEIQWLQSIDAALLASLVAISGGAGLGSELDIVVQDPDASTQQTALLMTGGQAAGSNHVDAQANPSHNVQLIDDLGRSSFLQLLSAQQLQLDHGSGTATFPGASIGSNIATVNHGLGRSPVFAIACSNGSGGGGLQVFPWLALTSSSTTQLNFRANSGVQEPAGATAGFYWLAIG